MAQQHRRRQNALVLRDARALEEMRRKRQMRRGRNIFFLLIFAALFIVSFTRVAALPPVNPGKLNFDQHLLWLLLGIAGVVLAFFPLSAIIIDLFDVNGTPRSIKGQDVLFFLLCAIVGIAAAVAIQYSWRPLSFLPMQFSDYISGYFFFVALVMAALIFLVRRKLPLPVFRQVGRQLFIGLVLAVILYFTLGQLSSFAWQHLTLNSQNLWRVPIFFLMTWPLFLLDEGICRGFQEHGTIRAIFASLFFKALLLVGLVVSIFLLPGLSPLSSLLPILALLLVFLVALCTQIYGSGRAAIAGATFSALVLAWCMATMFPITAY